MKQTISVIQNIMQSNSYILILS